MNRYQESSLRIQESSKYLAGGVASSLRSAMKPTPLFVQSASGSRIEDVDGNQYIDYLLAYGPLILGHGHPQFTKRVFEAMLNGATYGLQHDREMLLAKRLVEIYPGAEQVALSGSGTEAVMLALRLAKAYTGKQKVVRFYGHYHGWSDAIFTSFPSSDLSPASSAAASSQNQPGTLGQSVNSLEDIIIIPWNDEAALEKTLRQHHSQIAAVITEPIMCNSGCIHPNPGYLEQMRRLTEELDILLIFDEVITGFRVALGGAQSRFGVRPDLTTMGKAMAGGIPLSAVAGRKQVMNLIAQGKVSHLGTLNGNCMAAEAALAVIDLLSENQGQLLSRIEELTNQLVSGLRSLLKKHRLPAVINHIGPVFHLMFTTLQEVKSFDAFQQSDAQKYAQFAEAMLEEGILIRSNGLWYLSAAHGELEIAETLQAADRVLAALPK